MTRSGLQGGITGNGMGAHLFLELFDVVQRRSSLWFELNQTASKKKKVRKQMQIPAFTENGKGKRRSGVSFVNSADLNLHLCHPGGSNWAPTHTPAPRTGSTLAATSVGATRICQTSTDKQHD